MTNSSEPVLTHFKLRSGQRWCGQPEIVEVRCDEDGTETERVINLRKLVKRANQLLKQVSVSA